MIRSAIHAVFRGASRRVRWTRSSVVRAVSLVVVRRASRCAGVSDLLGRARTRVGSPRR